MAWVMKLPNGATASSDQFTLSDLGEIEDVTGEPWSTQNPMRSLKSAKAFLKAAYRANMLAEADVDLLTLGRLKSMFDWVDDKPWPGGDDGGDDAAPLDRSSSGSSPGASGASTGGRAKRGKSASATSS